MPRKRSGRPGQHARQGNVDPAPLGRPCLRFPATTTAATVIGMRCNEVTVDGSKRPDVNPRLGQRELQFFQDVSHAPVLAG